MTAHKEEMALKDEEDEARLQGLKQDHGNRMNVMKDNISNQSASYDQQRSEERRVRERV